MISQFQGAVFDHTKKHRILLWRLWDEKPRVLFIGLNPSTANELIDDPTVRRLASFAQSWAYGGFYLCNVFSYCTAHPEELSSARRPTPKATHPANQGAILMAEKLTALSVLMWGDGILKVENGWSFAADVANLAGPTVLCFGKTKKGNPVHPLYLSRNAQLTEYP